MHPTEMNIDPTKGVENKAKRVWKVHKLQSDLYSPSQSSHSQTYNREKGLFSTSHLIRNSVTRDNR